MRTRYNQGASKISIKIFCDKAMRLTFPHGFAMKLGTTPRFIPMLLARNLKRIALSAIRNVSVYAKAVSYTPGPVSVSDE